MQQDAGAALSDLVRVAGPEALDDARRVRAVLRDAAPDARLEVSLLVAAVEEGVGQRLARSSGGLVGGEIERLAADLVERRGLSPQNAGWAVRTVSWAVGRTERPGPINGHAGPARVPQGPVPEAPVPPGPWPDPVPEPWPQERFPVPGPGPWTTPGSSVATAWWKKPAVILSIAGAIVALLGLVVSLVLLGNDDPGPTGGGSGASDTAGPSDGAGSGSGTDDGSGSGSGTDEGSGSDTVTVGTGTFPDAQELGLLALLPDEYSAPSACQRWVGAPDDPLFMHRPLAAITCTPSGGSPTPPDRVTFVRFGSDTESEMTFTTAFPEQTGGDCVADQPMAGVYTQGGVDAGFFGCMVADDGAAYLAWTRTGRGVYAVASDGGARLDVLYTWFLSSRAAVA